MKQFSKSSKPIKINLSHTFGTSRETIEEDFFPIKVLRENFNVQFVDSPKEADVLFQSVVRDTDYSFLKEKNKKLVIVCGEDIFMKRNIFNLIESFLNKILKEKKYRIMDQLDSIIPKFISSFPIVYFFPKYLRLVKKISKGQIKNAYAMIQNDIKGDNILILPYFLSMFYYKMPKLIKKNNQKINPRKKFCAFIVSSNSSRERVKFFKMLSKYKKVDSYGRVMNNMGDLIFKKEWQDTHSDILKDYKFIICFENNFHNQYICEKLPNAMLANAIPIYRGAPDIGEYFNTQSFINYDDYGSYRKMIDRVIELDNDDKKYQEFLKQPWFKQNKIPETIKSKEKELIDFYKKVFDLA
jgi:hypothetical protein